MITVAAREAETSLDTLLDKVEAGEEVLITRDGKTVARLVGAETHDRARAIAALEALRILRKNSTLGGISWKELRDAGRRY